MQLFTNHIHKTRRLPKGNMLVMVTAVIIGLVLVIGIFGLGFVRLLGSNHEQSTAIESAALAAARDLSMIAVDTPECGFVSLSDAAPNANGTAAADNFYTPVRSINTILGTIRLDLIVADKLNDPTLKAIIKKDLANALTAQSKLALELNKALAPGYVSKDISNNNIEVYKDALAAYQANSVRMTGSSNYVNGSLKLSLGGITGGTVTNIPTPVPANWSNVPASAQSNNKYLSYTNVPYDNTDFVLAGIGDSIKLLSSKNWVATVPGLPYQLATIVKAEADQHLSGSYNASGYNVHADACAQPANVADPRPAPGALTFSFPDGLVPEITKPGDMLTYGPFNQNGTSCSYQYSDGGDFPFPIGKALMKERNWEFDPLDQNVGNVFRKALYDWWRRAGVKLDMTSAVAMLNDPAFVFKQPSPKIVDWKTHGKLGSSQLYNLGKIPNGNMHIYKVRAQDGLITYETKLRQPVQYLVSGENQLYSESIDAVKNSAVGSQKLGPFDFVPDLKQVNTITLTNTWDVYIRDQVYQYGKQTGGMHAGEPMDNDDTAMLGPLNSADQGCGYLGAKSYIAGPLGGGKTPFLSNQSDFAELSGFPASYYKQYATGSGKRPTYQTNGTAVDVCFRRQVTSGVLHKIPGNKNGYVGEQFVDPSLPALTPGAGLDTDSDGDIDGGDDD